MNAKTGRICGEMRRHGILVAVFGCLWIGSTLRADEPEWAGAELGGTLVTLNGRSFHDVTIVGIDPNGILFKHANGAGKVRFEELSPEIRNHFGYDPEAAAVFEGRALRNPVPQNPAGAVAGQGGITPVTFTFRTRVALPSRTSSYGGYPWSLTGCGPALANYYWPYQWGRWHPGLAYTRFPCRQAAERDFLISTGILPRPPGIRTWRYWR